MTKRKLRILIVDNYDSYTYNLLQALTEETVVKPVVIQNDDYDSFRSFSCSDFDCVVLSPGPGRPENSRDFGICRNILENWTLPLLGVCLGFQGLVWTFGGEVEHAPEVWHGRLSRIKHQAVDIFSGMPEVFSAVRYHSLCVKSSSLPDCLYPLAWSLEDNLLMACRHKEKPLFGVQFHPESICTEYGNKILNNFLDIAFKEKKQLDDPRTLVRFLTSKKEPNPLGYERKKQTFRVVSKKFETSLNDVNIPLLFQQVYENSNVPSFWLDSSLSTESSGRYSYMGNCSGPFSEYFEYHVERQCVEQYQILSDASLKHVDTFNCNIFDFLQMKLNDRVVETSCTPMFEFWGGFVGYFGYETKSDCCPVQNRYSSSFPDACFMFCDRFIALDHHSGSIEAVCLEDISKSDSSSTKQWLEHIELQVKNATKRKASISIDEQHDYVQQVPEFRWEIPQHEYIDKITRCKKFIYEGETYEICLTNRIHFKGQLDPFRVYCILREINPAPYSCYLHLNSFSVCCSSPERFIHVSSSKIIESKPIKGTIKRGNDDEEDIILKERLQNSEKDFSENLMIVDLVRNDFGRVCLPGKVWVPVLMNIESYATVHQLVSTVRGILGEDTCPLEAVRAAFPMGSMTGAPKVRTLELIDQLEDSARGIYSGSIGYLSLNGAINLNVVIRTIVITPDGAIIGSGGAITSQSIQVEEYKEILLKASALLTSISLSLGCRGRYHLS
ncbi:hypothetical protein GAYE_SCF37G5180 [Galdieria yellowstonensis]|uniref:Anthranilate synthase component 2 n=1 Tax=Galdieria yellowstonensis TaxID=3028027 RepID=A0AAV9IJ06_9RHOD|nr:hypothetical protein GAYE_SCF37G5180 [Galdieria yellowstonensis]